MKKQPPLTQDLLDAVRMWQADIESLHIGGDRINLTLQVEFFFARKPSDEWQKKRQSWRRLILTHYADIQRSDDDWFERRSRREFETYQAKKQML